MLPFRNRNLPLDCRVRDLISRLTTEEKISLLPTRQAAVERLGIGEYRVGGEGAHGVVDREGGKKATVFPQPIALSSTWDTELLKAIGDVIGTEARIYYLMSDRKGGITLWFPTIDMERDPRWGRTEEAYGEDPYLAGKLAAAMIQGAQGDDAFYIKAAAAPKHFYGNNTEENRSTASAVMTNRNKHEYYLKVFSYAFKEGKAVSLMTAYNEINGRPCLMIDEINTSVRDEWGCGGFIVCDGNDFEQTVKNHKYYKTHAETVAGALRAGLDCFTEAKDIIIPAIKDALDKNLICEADMDRALFNIFKIRIRLGEFDSDNHPYANIPLEKLASDESDALSLKAAREAVVLLKNDSFLPLEREKIKKALVVGEIADDLYPGWYEGNAKRRSTLLDSLKDTLGESDIRYEHLRDSLSFYNEETNGYIAVNEDGIIRDNAPFEERAVFLESNWGFGSFSYFETKTRKYLTAERTEDQGNVKNPSKSAGSLKVTADSVYGWFTMELFNYDEAIAGGYFYHEGSGTKWKKIYESCGINRAVEAAKDADTVFIAMGNHPLINGREGMDRPDIAFPRRWTEIIRRITKINKNCVLILTAGYPYAIQEEAELVPAVLYCGQGSQNLGRAVTDCLLGAYAPAGRLSMTWYGSVSDLPDFNDYDIIGKRTYQYFAGKPLYPFGHGLTFSEFEYSNLSLGASPVTLKKGENESLEVSFTVKNIGKYESGEVPQMYFKAKNPSVPRPRRQLTGFTRLTLKPGESKEVTFKPDFSELEFFDVNSNQMIVESGEYCVYIGASSDDIRLSGEFSVLADTVGKRDMSFVSAMNYDTGTNMTLLEDARYHTCVGHVPSADSDFAEVVYQNCVFDGDENRMNIRFGDGCKGKVHILLDGVVAASLPPDASYSAYADINVSSRPSKLTIKLFDGCKIRDFSFENIKEGLK